MNILNTAGRGLLLAMLLSSIAAAQPQPTTTIQVQGERGSVEVGPGGTMIRQTPGNSDRLGKGRWRNATLTRGPGGELILSDPEQGRIVMDRGPQGKTHLQLRGQNLTIDNELLLQWSEGQDVLLDQLRGR